VNRNGKYNVPYGFKTYANLVDSDRFRIASEKLKGVILSCSDFESSLKNIKSGDLVFLDPPYKVNHENNGFVKYNEKIFSWKDQERLADFIKKIKERKAFYILTNAKHNSINELFGSIDEPKPVQRASVIGGTNANRGMIGEYIFSNIKSCTSR
jgi:DNA adenine methylase